MNDDFVKMWKEAVEAHLNLLSHDSSGRTEVNLYRLGTSQIQRRS